MRYYLTCSFVLLMVFNLSAQEYGEDEMLHENVPGYIITADADTVWGRIKVQTRARSQVKTKFLSRESNRPKTYKPNDIIGYGYQTKENSGSRTQVVYKWRHFLKKKADRPPVPFGPTVVFMEVKASGKAILYSYYAQSNENAESPLMHYYYLEFKDGSRERKITQDDFDWAVPAFLEDCPKIRGLVGTRMDYSKLEEIVEIYNDCDNYGLDKCNECEIEKENRKKMMQDSDSSN